jgi:hypothetical protein
MCNERAVIYQAPRKPKRKTSFALRIRYKEGETERERGIYVDAVAHSTTSKAHMTRTRVDGRIL